MVPGRIADLGHISKPDGSADGDGRAEITWGARATNNKTFSASYAPVAAPGKGGSCTVYCHGASLGAAGGSNTTPGWGDPPLNCGSCHGTSVVGAPPSHSTGLTPTDCVACHSETVNPDGTLTTTGTHINGKVEASGCNNCHGDKNRGEPTTEASWAPPVDAQGATTGAKVGAHLRHVSGVTAVGSRLSRPFACTECHRIPTNGGPHGQPVIQWATGTNNLSNLGGLSPTYSGGTCASTYCHGTTLGGGTNTSPSWNTTGTAGCGSCHFLSSPAAPHPATDRSGLAITQVAQCAQCHPGTVNADGSINIVNGLHVNGLVDTDFHPVNYSNPATHGPDALKGLGTCKTCHGSDFAGQGQTPSCTACHAAAGHPTWLTECTFCHGQGNRAADAAFALVGNPPLRANQAAPPVGTQGELTASSPAVGAHLAHVQPSSSLNGALAIQIQCTECHGAVLPTDEKHADGSVAIGWGALARARGATPVPAEGNLIASWAANPTCTNYCHGITLAGGGTKVNPNWVAGAPEAACGTCHAARPGIWHPNNASCGQCHPGYTATSVDVITHVNGAIDPAGTSCSSCHGGPSGNAAPPNATTGATSGVKVGAHQAHVAAATLVGAGYPCATCHLNPTTMRHANDQVSIAWLAPATAGGVVPSPAAGNLAPAWETAPTCTNYCHGASLTAAGGSNRVPNWTLGATQVACGTCHASPPPLSAAAGANHPQNVVCASCHGTGYAQASVTGTARNSHVDGATTLVVSGCTACHGDRAATGVTLTNNLVASAPGEGNTLTTADTTGQSLVSAPGVGAHVAHLSGTTYRASALACTDCHGLPPSNTDQAHATGVGTGGARATVAWGNLARGVNVAFNNELVAPSYAGSTSGASGATAGSCASTYCHGQFKNGKKASVAWTATGGLTCNSCHGAGTGTVATLPGGNHPQPSNPDCGACHTGYSTTAVVKATHLDGALQVSGMNCSSCHGLSTRVPVASATDLDPSGNPLIQASPPVGITAGNQVGAHLAHVNQGATAPPLSSALHCVSCHVVPNHLGTGSATVTWGDIANLGGTASYDLATHSCSSTYCHGQFTGGNGVNTIAWGNGTPSKLACTSCHGDPPAHPHPQNLTCATCHTGSTASSVAVATHVDGAVTRSTSGCTSCHGELPAAGVTVSPRVNLAAAAPGATGTNTMDTVGQTAATAAGVGAHRAHLGAGVIGRVAIACDECHTVPTSNADTGHASSGAGTGGGRATLTWGPTATRSVNAWSGAPVVPTYTGSTSATGGTTGGSCASTYCHGNFTNGKNASVGWTTVGAMNCNSCHGAGTGVTATLPGGTHPQGNTTCSVCHAGYTNTTASAALHLNGRLDVAAATCTGCHGNVARTSVATATDLDVFNQPLQQSAPPVGVTAANQVGAHLAHVNQGATGAPLSAAQACVACHVVPTSTSHSDGVTTVAFGDISINAGASPTFNGTSHSCSSTYCHGQFPGGIQTNVVAWGTGSTAATKLGCTACHAGPPAHPHPSNPTCATCHTGSTATTVAAASHVDGVVNKSTSGCTSCHGELPAAGVTLTANLNAAAPGATGTNTLDTAGLAGAQTSAGTGAHRAHLVNTTYRAALACTECHALPPSNTDTSHGSSGAGTGGARATLTWGALARGVGAAFNNEVVAPSYAGSSTGAFTNTAGSCASTYCHGQFKNGKKATVTWTAAPGLTCNSCHGAGTGVTATLPGGSHPQGNTACGACHTGFTGTTVDSAVHLNGVLEVITMTCTSCHGDTARTPVASATWTDVNAQNLVRAAPPVDASSAAAGNLVGAHLAHVNQGATTPPWSNALRCENCHNGLVWTTAPHATPPNPIVWGNIAIADAALPLGYNVATKTCSNTYCHGQFPYGRQGTTVAWGTGTPAKLSCFACHGSSAAAPQPAHPHPQNATCAACHPGYTVSTVAAATHVDGLTTKSTAGCTACHGALSVAGVTLTANLVSAAPGVTGTNTVDTTGQTATTAAGVGVHQAHLTAGPNRNALLCTECHALPPSNTDTAHGNSGTGSGGARATLTFGTLATRSTNAWSGAPVTPSYAGSTTGAGGTTGGTCASTYCHGNFTNGAAASPAWTAAGTITCNSCHGRTAGTTASPPGGTHPNNATCGNCHTGYTGTTVNLTSHMNGLLEVVPQTCTSCHGDTARTPALTATDLDGLGASLVKSAPPVDSTGLASGNLVGAHLAHVNQGATTPPWSNALRCVNCHNGLVPTTAPHTPAANPVAFGNLATARGAAPTAYATANRTCSNTYCHGQFPYGKQGTTVAWGTGTPAKLTCFACHGSSAAAPQPNYPHPQNTGCAACHPGYTASTVAAATHVDGLTTKSTAGCTACHGDRSDTGVTLTLNTNKAAPGLGVAATSTDTTGAVASTSAGVGAHLAHLSGTTFRSALGCADCHSLPTTNTDTSHATGVGTGGARATLAWGALATDPAFEIKVPGYAQPTCSNVYCHNPKSTDTAATNKAPSWIVPGSVTCGSCHGLPPATTSHPANADCGSCHPGYTISTVNAAVHINGQLDGGESAGASPCLNCHKTDAATGAAYGKMVSDTTLYHHVVAEGTTFKAYPTTATGQACLQCHADHDVFNPTLNTANTLGRGANLRTTIATVPSKVAPASGNYANTDFSGMAGLCLSCHAAGMAKAAGQKSDGSTTTHPVDGTGFSSSAHAYAVAGSITTGASAINANCMKCHSDQQTATYPEKQSGTYRFALHTSVDRRLRNPMGQTTPVDDHAEDHCFRCHSLTTDASPGAGPAKVVANRDYFNATAMTVSSQNVFAAFNDAAHVIKHNVGGYDLIHQPTEAPAGAGGTKHVECEDCHEPHAAKAGAKAATNQNTVWGPITGVTGVTPTWGATAWTSATTYAAVTASTYEYQICFKCHSGANTGLAAWGGTGTWGGVASTPNWTDLALEFNPANKSRHPVVSALNAAGSGTNTLVAAQLAGQSTTWTPGSVMTCSDCHGADSVSPAAQGPHGSAIKWMLHGTNQAWPFTVAGATSGTGFRVATSETGIGTANGLFCRNCHPQMNSTGSNSIHRISGIGSGQHSSSTTIAACTGCHIRVPHGGKVSRLIITTNAPARYKVGAPNFAGFVKTAKDSYTVSANFRMQTSCTSQHNGNPASTEAW